MKIVSAFAATAFAFGVLAVAGPLAAETAPKTKKPRTPESIECSKQADAKNLHGSERKKFRSACIKKARAEASGKAPDASKTEKK